MSIRLKTPEEIEILKEGGRRHAEILSTLADMVAPGVSSLVLEEEALRLTKEGGDKPAFLGYRSAGVKKPFPAALCVSINDEIVHGIPNEPQKIIKEGDVVSLDFGIVHKGLVTDSAVSVIAGAGDDDAKKLLKMTKLALEKGIEAARLGGTIGDIGSAIGTVAQAGGLSVPEELVGHGVGYELHEDPYVPNYGVRGTGEKLVSGLVIAIEPIFNLGSSRIKTMPDGWTIKTRDGSRSAQFEHTIAITDKGTIIITQ